MLTDWSLLKPCLSYVRESESMDQDLDDWDFVPSTAIHLLGDLKQVNSPLSASASPPVEWE